MAFYGTLARQFEIEHDRFCDRFRRFSAPLLARLVVASLISCQPDNKSTTADLIQRQ